MAIRAAHIAPQKTAGTWSAGCADPAGSRRGSAAVRPAAAKTAVSSHRAASPRSSRARVVGIVVGKLDHMPLPAQRGQFKPPVGAEQRVQAALVGRIGVEDPVTLAQEDADPGTVRAGPDVGSLALKGFLVLVVVL